MKTSLVARKTLVEMLREPLLLAVVLSMPLFMLVLIAIGYRSVPMVNSYAMWVYAPTKESMATLDGLRGRQYADGRPVFTIQQVEAIDEAREALKQSPTTVLLDLSGSTPVLYGDATQMNFIRASLELETGLRSKANQQGLVVEEVASTAFSPRNEFEAYTPGMIIFAMLLVIPQTALVLGRELRWGTLRRLQLTTLTTGQLLGGVSLAQLLVSVFQVLIIFAAAWIFGFQNHGSLWLSLGISLLVACSAIGMGCVVAGFSKKDSDALNTGSVFSMLQVFLSGSFFPMASPELLRIAGHGINLFDFIPASHALLALQQVMCYGATWSQVSFRVTATALLSLVYFGLGVWLFGKFHKPA